MKLNNVDLNKVAVFCQILESGTYRKTSEILNVTPSALSQSLTVLEHSLGFPLFHRVGRRLVPTENGLRLYRDFRHHHNGFLEAVAQLTRRTDQISGQLRIGAYLEFAKSQLAPMLTAFLRDYPETQIKLTFETPSRLQQLLEIGKLDLCFSIFPSRQNKAVRSAKIYRQEMVMITPGRWFSKNPTFDEILRTPIVEYYLSHQPIRKWIHLHYRKRPKDLNIRAYVSTAEMVLEMVKQGAGVGIVPKYLVDTHSQSLEICRPTDKRFNDHLWLLERKNAPSSVLHQTFVVELKRRGPLF